MKKYIQPQTTQMAINIESHLLIGSDVKDTKLQVKDGEVVTTDEYSIGKGWASDNWTEEE